MILRHEGRTVRCVAHRRYAVAVPSETDPAALVVTKRTSDPHAVAAELRRIDREVDLMAGLVFDLRTGERILVAYRKGRPWALGRNTAGGFAVDVPLAADAPRATR